MSNGKGQTPRKGYNWAKYVENYDRIFRKQPPTQPATLPMNIETTTYGPDGIARGRGYTITKGTK